MILTIDPGNEFSAFVLFEPKTEEIREFGKICNIDLYQRLGEFAKISDFLVIEKIMSYGMPVGETVFDTVFWSGRFAEKYDPTPDQKKVFRMPRKEAVLHLTHTVRGKDSNVRAALIERYGEPGTKKNPGKLYGITKDVWAALGVAVTYSDKIMDRVWLGR